MVQPELLEISESLARSLDEWNLDWEDDDSPTDPETWESRGRELTANLQAELGPAVVVAFYLDGLDVPPFDKAGFAVDHRVERNSDNGEAGFSRYSDS